MKLDELQKDAIVYFEWGECQITAITPKTIRLKTFGGQTRIVHLKRGWNLRLRPSETTLNEFRLRQDVREYSAKVHNLTSQIAQKNKKIKELQPPKHPCWFKISNSNRRCTEDYLKTVISQIQPVAECVHMSWNNSGDEKYPISFQIFESTYNCDEAYLKKILDCIQPVAQSFNVEFGRY